MKKTLVYFLVCIPILMFSQEQDSALMYKKRVLDHIELDILSSYYTQDGDNASVTGGIGTEKLDDYASNISVAIPLNDDDVLTIDGTVSAYTSASSSNLNPFLGEDDDDDEGPAINPADITGTPWVASSGESREDTWVSGVIGYSHSSDDRNKIYSLNSSYSMEYDYTSVGVGAGFARLFNKKNTEVGISTNLYFDNWNPQTPKELRSYVRNGGDLNSGLFKGVDIYNQSGNIINKDGANRWTSHKDFLVESTGRNTYSLSLSFSQILGKNAQFSLFSDLVLQQGWLANPLQRVYFSDRDNYFIGNPNSIPNYTSRENTDVFQLADDIERLPSTRLKIPIGLRYHHYINEFLVLKSYYRYYWDDWGLNAHTLSVELPIKLNRKWTLYPSYRIYSQTAADYFAPFDQHVSTQQYYTSDFDLSEYYSNQFGFGFKYNDAMTKIHIWKIGLKTFSLDYGFYQRNTGLTAHIVSFGVKFLLPDFKKDED